jgi:hypothetical protein
MFWIDDAISLRSVIICELGSALVLEVLVVPVLALGIVAPGAAADVRPPVTFARASRLIVWGREDLVGFAMEALFSIARADAKPADHNSRPWGLRVPVVDLGRQCRRRQRRETAVLCGTHSALSTGSVDRGCRRVRSIPEPC